MQKLLQWTRPLAVDPRAGMAQRACRALGAIGTDDDATLLRRIVEGRGKAGVRRAALHGVATLGGAATTSFLRERVGDPFLRESAVRELARVGDESSVRVVGRSGEIDTQ